MVSSLRGREQYLLALGYWGTGVGAGLGVYGAVFGEGGFFGLSAPGSGLNGLSAGDRSAALGLATTLVLNALLSQTSGATL